MQLAESHNTLNKASIARSHIKFQAPILISFEKLLRKFKTLA